MAALYYNPDRLVGPATARLTRREDRSAQLGRGPENLGNRAAKSVPKRIFAARTSRPTKRQSFETKPIARNRKFESISLQRRVVQTPVRTSKAGWAASGYGRHRNRAAIGRPGG